MHNILFFLGAKGAMDCHYTILWIMWYQPLIFTFALHCIEDCIYDNSSSAIGNVCHETDV